MEITTKFNIGDDVLFINPENGKVESGIIRSISIEVDDKIIKIRYTIKKGICKDFIGSYLSVLEHSVFKDKNALFEYLYKIGEDV